MTELSSKHPRFSGSCLCGDVQYSIKGAPVYAVYCYCSECRKFSGSPFSALLGIGALQLSINKGDESTIGRFEKSAKTHLRFCRRCGSSIYVEKIGDGFVHLRMGTLDTSPPIEINAHINTDSKAAWYSIPEDGLVRYTTNPPKELVAEFIRRSADGL